MHTISACYSRALAILLILIPALLPAQVEIGTIGSSYQSGVPQGALARQFDRTGHGGAIEYFHRLAEDSPFYLGGQLSLMRFERYREDFIISTPGGIGQNYRMRVSSNLFSGYLGLRVVPFDNRIRPYAEALVGFKNFYRSARLEERNFFGLDREEIDRRASGTWTLGYGGAAGLTWFFGKSRLIGIDLRCAWLAGGEVRVYRLKEVIDPLDFEEDPFSAFTSTRSVSPMLIPQLGLLIRTSPSPPESGTTLDFSR